MFVEDVTHNVDSLPPNAQRLMNILSDNKPLPDVSVSIQGQLNIDLKSKNKNYRLNINFNDKVILEDGYLTFTEDLKLNRFSLNNRNLTPELSKINLNSLLGNKNCDEDGNLEYKVRFNIPEHISSFADKLDTYFEKMKDSICNNEVRKHLKNIFISQKQLLPSGQIHFNTQKNDPLKVIITDHSETKEVVLIEIEIDELFEHHDGNILVKRADSVTSVNGEKCSSVKPGEGLHIKSLLEKISKNIKDFRYRFCNNSDKNTGEAVDGTPSTQILKILSDYLNIVRKVDDEMESEQVYSDDLLAEDHLLQDNLLQDNLLINEPINDNILQVPDVSLPTKQLLYQSDNRVYLILKIILFIFLLYAVGVPQTQKSLAKLLKADKDLVMLLTIVIYIVVCALIYVYL